MERLLFTDALGLAAAAWSKWETRLSKCSRIQKVAGDEVRTLLALLLNEAKDMAPKNMELDLTSGFAVIVPGPDFGEL